MYLRIILINVTLKLPLYLCAGTEENQIKEIRPIIEKCYETHFAGTFKEPTLTDFYRAICETVEYK